MLGHKAFTGLTGLARTSSACAGGFGFKKKQANKRTLCGVYPPLVSIPEGRKGAGSFEINSENATLSGRPRILSSPKVANERPASTDKQNVLFVLSATDPRERTGVSGGTEPPQEDARR